MPRQKKPAGTAVDRRNGQRADLAPVAAPMEPLPAPQRLRPDALEQWDAYWEDLTAGLTRPADRGLLYRWIGNVNRYLTLLEEADESPTVHGSNGQPRPNPLYDTAYRIEASIRADEAQLGIGPKNRSALGLQVLAERRSLADMNAKYVPGGGDAGGDEASSEDPRLTVIDGSLA